MVHGGCLGSLKRMLASAVRDNGYMNFLKNGLHLDRLKPTLKAILDKYFAKYRGGASSLTDADDL